VLIAHRLDDVFAIEGNVEIAEPRVRVAAAIVILSQFRPGAVVEADERIKIAAASVHGDADLIAGARFEYVAVGEILVVQRTADLVAE